MSIKIFFCICTAIIIAGLALGFTIGLILLSTDLFNQTPSENLLIIYNIDGGSK